MASPDYHLIWTYIIQTAIISESTTCDNALNATITNKHYNLVRHGSDCIAFVYIPMTFSKSMEFCQAVTGGHLTDVDEASQNVVMNFTSQVHQKYEEFWIGLVYLDALKRWIWVNGARFSYTEKFQSDAYGNCVVLQTQTNTGSWENIKCSNERPFICKLPRDLTKDKGEGTDVTMQTTTTPDANITNTTVIPETSSMSSVVNSTTTASHEAEHQTSGMEDLQDWLTIGVVLATLLFLSLAINIIFTIRCVRNSNRQKHQQTIFHLGNISSASTTPILESSQPSSTKSKTRHSLSLPRSIKRRSKDGLDIPLHSPENSRTRKPSDDIHSSSFTFPRRGKNNSRKDSTRSELTMFVNEIYKGNQPGTTDDGGDTTLLTEQNMSAIGSSKKLSFSDNEDPYDVPISPSSGPSCCHAFRGSGDDTTYGNDVSPIQEVRENDEDGTESDHQSMIYSNESMSNIIPEEEEDPNEVLQFRDGKLEFNEEEVEYANA